ncbi:receptor-like protein 9DC3 [Camellia sinensis]|uniref:receptor-like protein 9DC3 n=1 Tax=Camellia sinensis TaxID=4442 RepID=UPI0010367BEF|nr:receptor-like protein 9DC3 [Camellia sinensis]
MVIGHKITTRYHEWFIENFGRKQRKLSREKRRDTKIEVDYDWIGSASGRPSAYPKVASWKLEGETSNCCSWDGVECDRDTGHVIGLGLSSSFLYGFLNSRSSLFSAVHLQRLNLANNDFNYSHIPSEICQLSSIHSSKARLLKLEKYGLRSLLQKLTNLKELHLSKVIISSEVPHTLANLPSLTTLVLKDCGLRGEFPVSIFHLPKLQFLSVCYNENLTGHLPKFHQSSPLQDLKLAVTSFSGKLPDSIGNLNFLKTLDFTECYFSGSIPDSLGNLTQLTDLFLSYNLLQGPIPSSFSELKNLEAAYLSYNNLSDSALEIFFKLKILTELNLSSNKLKLLTKKYQFHSSKVSNVITRFMQLEGVPRFYTLPTRTEGFEQHPDMLLWVNLAIISLSYNRLQGPLPIPPLSTQSCSVYYNKLTGKIPPLFCRLSFLYTLDLSNNNLAGTIPPCLSNFSDSLSILNLKGNNFHGPIPHLYNKGNTLKVVDFSGNQLQGKVPRSLASCTVLEILDLSNNLFEDTFPFWLVVLTKLQALILRSNKFYGAIGSFETKLVLPNLRIIDLSHNDFTVDLPWDSGQDGYWAHNNHKVSRMVHRDFRKQATQTKKTKKEGTWKPKLIRSMANKHHTPPSLSLDDLSSTPPTREKKSHLIGKIVADKNLCRFGVQDGLSRGLWSTEAEFYIATWG